MARRGFGGTALRAALGAVTGVAEGLQQRDVVAAEKKRMADAAALDQARFLISSGFRVAPDAYNTEDPAARSILPPLEMPSTARPSLSPMTMPSTAPRPSAGVSRALSAAVNRDFKVDATKPSLSLGFNADPLALDSRTTRMTEVLGRGQEARAAQEAIAASLNLPGGMNMRFLAPETAAQITARTMADYEAKKRADAAIGAQAKADERKVFEENARRLAAIYTSSYTKDGKPMPYAEAFASAMQGKNPIESGFLSKPMTEEDRQRIEISKGQLDVSRGLLNVAQGRLDMANRKTQEALGEVQNFYDNERQIIAEFMPTTVVGKDGKVQYIAPKVTPSGPSLMATKSDWTNWAASEDAQRYASSVKRISDSFAVAKEGRAASNADKESYLNAVMVRPGEFKNYKLMDDKWKRLQSYINFLESKEKKGVSNRTTAGTAGGSALEELENMGM